LIDLLRFLQPDHPSRPHLAAVVHRQVDALARLQDASGHWHTVLDHPETYLEHSVAAMMAWAIPQAVRLGLVSDSTLDVAARAFEATLAATDDIGNLTGVSEATPAGDLATYAAQPTGVFPWGQGPWLLALADRLAPDLIWEGLP
jgi:unsaturated rhamnogalacturonyl hydrolase